MTRQPSDTPPSSADVLSGLKDFQRATVEHAFRRLWLDEDRVKRFLVADEVGLGKTMVAKGVIAKTVEHLWDCVERSTIVYICSNAQIARQNLSRLNVVDGAEHRHADRLTMLPAVLGDMRANKVNFVSFTPGTSFSQGWTQGKSSERVLLYWLLERAWGREITGSVRWVKFFRGLSGRASFERQLAAFDRTSIDDGMAAAFGGILDTTPGPGGLPLSEELRACADRFTHLRTEAPPDLWAELSRLISALRTQVAHAAVDHLEPDLVILDEFQRFKDLLDTDAAGSDLASAVFDHPRAKVLLLSATPYKMYTLPDEPEGEDHYRDFTRTVDFLAGSDRARRVASNLRAMRESLVTGADRQRALAARDEVQADLRAVMSRTERLAITPDRDGMLTDQELPGVHVTPDDLRGWRTFSEVARVVGERHDVFEYWRSTPYALNLMERGTYQVRSRLEEAVEQNPPSLAAALTAARGLLSWDTIQKYEHLDPGNAKMRGLAADVIDRGAWRLLWMPPSLPYYTLGGAYAEPELQAFTKRLVFSAWAVVPKSIAVILSYEAERRAVVAEGKPGREYTDRPITPPLQMRLADGRPAGMPALAMSYPSTVLARLGDPYDIAREQNEQPIDKDRMVSIVRGRVEEALRPLAVSTTAPVDQRWYWAAPFLLDHHHDSGAVDGFLARLRGFISRDPDQSSQGLEAHLKLAASVHDLELGASPEDLVDVITLMAVAGPGVCLLRALSRVCGGRDSLDDADLRHEAFGAAGALRALFNRPEVVALLRGEDAGSYWRLVLEHAVDGCLQAVLDEYAHVLVEAEGLQGAAPHRRAEVIGETMVQALTLRSSSNVVDEWKVIDGVVESAGHRVTSHFAARFGARATDDTANRDEHVRTAFNSPFRPFVLASTSVGQEGLDFHTYSHAIVHWNLPGNPVDLEQREGRVHRYKGHAVRKNVASAFGAAALGSADDPWGAVFDAAVSARKGQESELTPFWVFAPPGGATIERYVPALPLSREVQQLRRLMRTVGAYRMVMGQPRQEDLLRYVGESAQDAEWLRLDLSPPVA